MKMNHTVKLRYFLLAIALSVVFFCPCRKASGDINDFMKLNSYMDCVVPLVILQNGTNNVSIIYMNDTSAKISIDATPTASTYNYSLNITNNNASLWEVRLEYFDYPGQNYTNSTIILHNDTTSLWQIEIEGENINQNNTYYNLTNTSTIYIGVQNLVENSPGTTVLSTHLRIKNPNTTIYTLYTITFEFT